MRRRQGLTLVELLAGLVIASALAVAALGVTTAIARSELALRRNDSGPASSAAALKALVETDLVHAHHWRPVDGGFALQTTARLAGQGMRLEHVPAEVTYRVTGEGDRTYLVRSQETPPERPSSELAAVGATAAVLVPEKDVRPNRFGWKAISGGATARVSFGGTEVVVTLPGEWAPGR